ncbi:MAG: lecithin retinol acyltransferase family protein [Burkholderiaceae bacterium]
MRSFNSQFQVGDKICVQRLGYRHIGIYVGPRFANGTSGDVVENDRESGGVILSNLAEFSGGKDVSFETRVARNFYEQELIAKRALSLIGQQFDLFTFNCEHFANWAQTGKVESPQLQRLSVVALLLLGMFALSRKV